MESVAKRGVGIAKQGYTIYKKFVALTKAVPGVFEKVANFIFLYNMYKLALKEPDEFGPKLVTILLFICTFSTFILTYSCVLNNLLQNRTYEDQILKDNNIFQVMIKVLLLTLVGPVFILVMEIFDQLKKILDLIFSLPPFMWYGGAAGKKITASLYMWLNFSCFSLNSA